MNKFETLTEMFSAGQQADDKGVFIINNSKHETFVSYRELYREALERLHAFHELGVKSGDEVVLQLDGIEDFIVSFWAGLLGGLRVIPLSVRSTEEHRMNLREIWKQLENPYLLTSKDTNGLNSVNGDIGERTFYREDLTETGSTAEPVRPDPDDIAFIQYSSGSTGTPKGIVLTHRNILANINAIARGIRTRKSDTSLSWMPLTHDMGLIGFHLTPMAIGVNHYLMPVSLFIRRPLLWLEKAAQHRVTILGAPDFGLKVFLSAMNRDKDYGWDLSQVRLIFNGAEPINYTVCQRFTEELKKYRLAENCLFPVYGLAEASVAVTFPRINQPIDTVVLNSKRLSIGRRVEEVNVNSQSNGNVIPFVDVGFPVTNCRVKIVDQQGKHLEEMHLGRILIKGKNVTHSFYRDHRNWEKVAGENGWLDTGDLGFLRNRRLVITGREKEVVVVNGQNHYLYTLERMAEEVDGIKTRKAALCGIYNPATGKEEVCAFVVYRRKLTDFVPLARKLMAHIYRKAGISLKHVIPVSKLPVTTSGKLMRHRFIHQFREGVFDEKIASVNELIEADNRRNGETQRDDSVKEIEDLLLTAVRDVLGTGEPGLRDNLSRYGADSITLQQLLQRVETCYPGMLKMVDFFDHPTVSQLAALIAERKHGNGSIPVDEFSAAATLALEDQQSRVKRLALVFPGQGSQHTGMGRDMCQYFPVADRTFEEASDVLNQDIKALCFSGAMEELTRTENAQPALLTVSVAKYRVYRQEFEVTPFLAAGHSLGEYSALVCANALSFTDALTLVKRRGELMRDAAGNGIGGMMAVFGIHKNAVEEECSAFTDPNHCVVVANTNSSTQVVISGHNSALQEVSQRLTAKSARVVPLKVSAAFHSPLMALPAQSFSEELANVHFKMPEWPVFSNVTAQPYEDVGQIPQLLAQQMTRPVRWHEIMEQMEERGVDVAIEMGPKKVLKNLIKKSSRKISVYSANTQEDLQELYELNPEDFIDRRPNPLERCLAEAMTIPNRNYDEEQYRTGVIEPYQKLKQMYYQLEEEKKEPDETDINEARTILNQIKTAKQKTRNKQNLTKQQLNKRFCGESRGAVFSKGAPLATGGRQSIAIIGVAARTAFADNVREFWQNLIEGRDGIHEIPDNRQEDVDRFFPYLFRIKPDTASRKNKKRYLNAAYLKNVDHFDYRFFRISPKEASLMDPCQRLFLETAYEVLEDAGYAGADALKHETGVYVGYSDDAKLNYFQMVSQVEPASIAVAIAGNLSSIVPSRISYFMDLKGPSLLVDTACSSSLVSIHLACQAIRNGDCDQAIVGGVRVNLLPIAHTAKVGIESSDGKTKTFDDRSDGTGVGEGVGAVLLKPLDKALEDRDHIYAVIKGSAVNQDGHSLGITAPSAEAQARVLVKAWQNADIHPETLSYIEAHGTGTRVGDPIEVEAVTNAFRQFTQNKQFCGIGSVKTNIGHLFEGAGIFGFIKAALALKHRTLPPSLHFRRPNRAISFEESPVYVVDKLTPWQTDGLPLRCGVTAFGFSGTNCHIVLEEAPAVEPLPESAPSSYLLCLSARSKAALFRSAQRFRDFLISEQAPALYDISYTAAVGRQHFDQRLAIIAGTHFQMAEKLKRIIDSGEPSLSVDGNVPGNIIDTAHRYLLGEQPDWRDFYIDKPGQRVSLPLYPFESERCWLDIPEYEDSSAKELEGKLFFDMEWVEDGLKAVPEPADTGGHGLYLLIRDEHGVGEQIAGLLKQDGHRVVQLTPGSEYRQMEPDHYSLDGSEAQYEKLLLELGETPIYKVVFLANLAQLTPVTSLKRLRHIQEQGAYNLYHLTKMLLTLHSTEKIEIIVVTDYVNNVTGKEEVIKPENAPLMGLAYAIDRECENITAWCIDCDNSIEVPQLLAEIKTGKQFRLAAYRQSRRYIERFIPVDADGLPDTPINIKDNGVYLITGGTGGIGLEMGKFLASKAQNVRIALVNRTPMPGRDRWDNILSDEEENKRTIKKINAVREMEDLGAEVRIYSADCSGYRRMKTILDDLRQSYGTIDGIIHGAGVEGEGLMVRKDEKKFANVLNPKVDGTWILDRLTQTDNLDFLVLFSTVATFLMNPGQSDYTAANAYLDSFAEYRSRQGKKTLAVNWVTWKETGMAVNFNANFDIIFKAIPTAQAIDAFEMILSKKINRVLVGELNLDSKLINLLKNAQFCLSGPIRGIIEKPESPVKGQSGDEPLRKKIRKVKLTGRDGGDYSKSELLVAKVWGEVLGFEEFRIDDNFYELGGDSILATQVVNRINSENNLKISLIEIFNHETIKDLANYVESLV